MTANITDQFQGDAQEAEPNAVDVMGRTLGSLIEPMRSLPSWYSKVTLEKRPDDGAGIAKIHFTNHPDVDYKNRHIEVTATNGGQYCVALFNNGKDTGDGGYTGESLEQAEASLMEELSAVNSARRAYRENNRGSQPS